MVTVINILISSEWECCIPILVFLECQYVNNNSHHDNYFHSYQVQNGNVLFLSWFLEYKYVNHNSHHGNYFPFVSNPEWECSISIQEYQYVNHNSHHGNSYPFLSNPEWGCTIPILVFMENQYVNHNSRHGNYFPFV